MGNADTAARTAVREAVRSLLTALDRYDLRPACYGDLEHLLAEYAEPVPPRQYTVILTDDELRVVLAALDTRRNTNVTEIPEGLDEDDEERIGAECDIYETGIINAIEARLEAIRRTSLNDGGTA